LARKANVRSITACAGLSRRRYHDNDATGVSAAVEERRGADAIMPLSGQQHEAGKVAKSVDQGDDLGRQAAARPSGRLGMRADGLILRPPFAPDPY
jgi:hypothetical protein